MLVTLARLAIGVAAPQADLLGARPEQPDGPLRLPCGHHMLGRCGDDRAARAVVDRSGTQVPAIQMAGNHDHAQRRIAAGQFGDHIAGLLLSDILRGQHQLQLHRLAALHHAFQIFRIGNRQRARRNRGHALFKIGIAGMRIAVMVGACRADDDCCSTFLGRNIRPDKARGPKCAVARPVLGRCHGMADKGDLALEAAVRRGNQIGQRREIDDFGRQTLVAGAAAVAQGRDRQLLREGADHGRRLLAADPGRHHIGFAADIAETQRRKLGHGPVSRPRFRLGSRLSRSDLGGQALDDIIGNIVLQGLVLQRHHIGRAGQGRGGQKQRDRASEHLGCFYHG